MYVSGQLEWNFLVAHAAAAFTSSSSKQNATQQKLKKKHTHNLCRIIADSFSRIAAAAQSAMNHEVIVSIIARHRNQWAPTIETKNGIFTCAVCECVFVFLVVSSDTHWLYFVFHQLLLIARCENRQITLHYQKIRGKAACFCCLFVLLCKRERARARTHSQAIDNNLTG